MRSLEKAARCPCRGRHGGGSGFAANSASERGSCYNGWRNELSCQWVMRRLASSRNVSWTVPPRVIPLPASVSHEARAFLASPPMTSPDYPAPDDLAGRGARGGPAAPHVASECRRGGGRTRLPSGSGRVPGRSTTACHPITRTRPRSTTASPPTGPCSRNEARTTSEPAVRGRPRPDRSVSVAPLRRSRTPWDDAAGHTGGRATPPGNQPVHRRQLPSCPVRRPMTTGARATRS